MAAVAVPQVFCSSSSRIMSLNNVLRGAAIHRRTFLRGFSTQLQTLPEIQHEESASLIDPMKHPDFFEVHSLFTIKDLFNARVHYGHKEGSLNDHMRPFIYGSRLGHTIFDLDQTADMLRQALNFTAHVAFKDGIILFVSRNPQIAHLIDKTAKECNEFSHTRRWRKGTFTNSTKEFQAVTRLPDLCIFINTLNDVVMPHRGVTDAAKMCIPSVGIVDSNCDPRLITYPVPGNDDTPVSIELYCQLFKTAILRGKTARKKILRE